MGIFKRIVTAYSYINWSIEGDAQHLVGGDFHRGKITCRIYHYVKATLAGTLAFQMV
jgi:hypothetical protein